jgi:hypothetical protein
MQKAGNRPLKEFLLKRLAEKINHRLAYGEELLPVRLPQSTTPNTQMPD